MLSFLVNAAYSTVTGIFLVKQLFYECSLVPFLPLLVYWLVVSEGDRAGKLQLHRGDTYRKIHLRWQVCTSISKRWSGRSVILTVNKHTDRLITPFAVMYAHMFSHTSMETRKSHTYWQIPGYWASLGILLSDMWVAEHKANSAGVYNWRMLLVSPAAHRWL